MHAFLLVLEESITNPTKDNLLSVFIEDKNLSKENSNVPMGHDVLTKIQRANIEKKQIYSFS